MIYVYDYSVVGCCGRRDAVRRLVNGWAPDAYRLWNTRRFHGKLRANAERVYTDAETIANHCNTVGVPVLPIGPDNL